MSMLGKHAYLDTMTPTGDREVKLEEIVDNIMMPLKSYEESQDNKLKEIAALWQRIDARLLDHIEKTDDKNGGQIRQLIKARASGGGLSAADRAVFARYLKKVLMSSLDTQLLDLVARVYQLKREV